MKRKLSEWRKEGFPKREHCRLFGFDKIPVEMIECEDCGDREDCTDWSHFWEFYPMLVEAEMEPCGVD